MQKFDEPFIFSVVRFGSESVDLNIFSDPDPDPDVGSQNLADPTDSKLCFPELLSFPCHSYLLQLKVVWELDLNKFRPWTFIFLNLYFCDLF